MTVNSFLQIALYILVVLFFVKPLGKYMARVYQNEPCGLNQLLLPVERFIYRVGCVNENEEMSWSTYLLSMLLLNLLGMFVVYLLQRIQVWLPLNPQHFRGISPLIALNTAISFVTNTNWQAYSGESSLSYLTQMLALAVQNFISAATGMSILLALIRGLSRTESSKLGNFWQDMVRSILYILLPLSIITSLVLCAQGVPQSFKSYQSITPLEATANTQLIPLGPVASQVAIKQVGSNGGGFFNANSAHPFENPTPLTNFVEMLLLILIPASLCYTYGVMIKDTRQSWAILTVMFLIFTPLACATVASEQAGNPVLTKLGVLNTPQNNLYSAGNMEGKETRFGITNSALWASATTATSNGSVNAMHDSFTPLGGLILLCLMGFGEVIFGGVGSGLYGMLMLIIITVFVAGLMVGRTPEFLGKKIEPFEMKMAALSVLVMPITVLILTAIAVIMEAGKVAIGNPGAHGFTEILYAFTSMTNNNGSAFAGLNAATPFYTLSGSLVMLIGRYAIAIPILALAGSMAKKKKIPLGTGTLATHTPLFIGLLIGTTIMLTVLSFLPALALGPIVEQMVLWK